MCLRRYNGPVLTGLRGNKPTHLVLCSILQSNSDSFRKLLIFGAIAQTTIQCLLDRHFDGIPKLLFTLCRYLYCVPYQNISGKISRCHSAPFRVKSNGGRWNGMIRHATKQLQLCSIITQHFFPNDNLPTLSITNDCSQKRLVPITGNSNLPHWKKMPANCHFAQRTTCNRFP